MTLVQKNGTLPPALRDAPRYTVGGTAVTTFWVDAHGLPHRVVEASRQSHTRITETFTYSRWGAVGTVTAPPGVPGLP